MALSSTERSIKSRKRMKAKGKKLLSVWVKKSKHEEIKSIVELLNDGCGLTIEDGKLVAITKWAD